ncbi:inositol oxygenase family protein [Neisseria sp.]|uniref:inositol oxygenase family protein n=1 Tax=Neisseria sp. TaxID=192066 RepID=UPI0034A57B4D
MRPATTSGFYARRKVLYQIKFIMNILLSFLHSSYCYYIFILKNQINKKCSALPKYHSYYPSHAQNILIYIESHF